MSLTDIIDTLTSALGLNKAIKKELTLINTKINKMADNLKDLSLQVDALQTALDDKQAKITEAIDALKKNVADLKAQIGSPVDNKDEIKAISEKFTTLLKDLEETNLSGTPPVTPPDPGGNPDEASTTEPTTTETTTTTEPTATTETIPTEEP